MPGRRVIGHRHEADARRGHVEQILEPLAPGRPGFRQEAVAVQFEHVERGEGHRAPRPVARLEDGLDALAAVACHRLAVQHG